MSAEDILMGYSQTSRIYRSLPENLRGAVKEEFEKHHEKADSVLKGIHEKEELSTKALLQSFLTPDEELIPIDPLKVDSYYIYSAKEPYSEEYLDSGYGAEMYLTNKRLIIVSAGESQQPILEDNSTGDKKEYKVGNKSGDYYNFVPFLLNNIYGISQKLENEVSCSSIVREKKGRSGGLLAGGIILIFLCFIIGVASEFESPWWSMLLLIGIILLIVGALAKFTKIERSHPSESIMRRRQLRLVTLDPVYMNRASLTIEINKEHTIKSIMQWVRELQNRCEAICEPRAFEKTMLV